MLVSPLFAKEIENFMYFVQDVPMAMLNIFTAFKIICQKLAVAAKRGGGGMGVSCTSSFSWPPRLSPCQISLPFCVCYRHRLWLLVGKINTAGSEELSPSDPLSELLLLLWPFYWKKYINIQNINRLQNCGANWLAAGAFFSKSLVLLRSPFKPLPLSRTGNKEVPS